MSSESEIDDDDDEVTAALIALNQVHEEPRGNLFALQMREARTRPKIKYNYAGAIKRIVKL